MLKLDRFRFLEDAWIFENLIKMHTHRHTHTHIFTDNLYLFHFETQCEGKMYSLWSPRTANKLVVICVAA